MNQHQKSLDRLTQQVQRYKQELDLARQINDQRGQVFAKKQIRFAKTEIRKIHRLLKGGDISDHAFLRYLERVLNINLDSTKKQLMDKLPKPLPEGTLKVDGMTLICRDGMIVTIIF